MQIMFCSWQNSREMEAYKKEMRILKVRIRAARRAGIYAAMRTHTRLSSPLSSDKLREIASR